MDPTHSATPHGDLFWTYLVVGAFGVGALLTFADHYWIAPVKRLAALLRNLAVERPPRSYILNGAPVFTRIAGDIELIAKRHSRLAEQAAQEEFNLKAILRSMVEGVIVVDPNHVIREVNEAFVRQFGLAIHPLNRTVLEAVRVAAIQETIEEAFLSGQPQSREISIPAASVEQPPRHFDVSAVCVRREGGPEEVVAVFHDISRLKQLEDVRREFVANVSHELRTPLSIFRGYVETLMDQPEVSPAELQRILATMRRHSVRLNALIDDLLTLARLESRRISLEPATVRLEPFLRQIASDFRGKLDEKGIALSLDLPPGLPPLEADPFRIEQVVYNLLDNAIKYSAAGGTVTLRASADARGDRLTLAVADQGMGIPPADLPHIFERFYRVDKARSRDLGGTGLGLSIVKHIVQLHGGEVAAASEMGRGTTISLSFPLTAPELPAP